MRTRPWVIAFLLIAAGCSRSGASSPVIPSAPSAPLWQLSGTVRCNGGDPIAGATLEVIDGPSVGREAATDASGRYLFVALEPAVFSVRASAVDHHSVTRAVDLTSNAVVDFSLPDVDKPVSLNDHNLQYFISSARSEPSAPATMRRSTALPGG